MALTYAINIRNTQEVEAAAASVTESAQTAMKDKALDAKESSETVWKQIHGYATSMFTVCVSAGRGYSE